MTDETSSSSPSPSPSGEGRPRPLSSTPILKRSLVWGAIVAAVIAVVAGGIGAAVAGTSGLLSGLVGPALALVFLGLTAVSILAANRTVGTDAFVTVFFVVVLGTFLVKFVLFVIVALALKDAAWVQPVVLFLSLVAAVVGSLAVDVIVVTRARLGVVSDPR